MKNKVAGVLLVIGMAILAVFGAGPASADPVPPPPPNPFGQLIEQATQLGQQLGLPVAPPVETPPSAPVDAAADAPAQFTPAPEEFAISGDSYGSGNGDQGTPDAPGLPRYNVSTTQIGVNFCLRTTTSAAQLVARNMGFAPIQTRDHSCTSATASNVLDDVQYPNEGLQINAFNENTKYGIYEQGGNPYFMPIFECILTTFPSQGQSCPQAAFDKAMWYYTQELPNLTRRNLQAILDRAPNMANLAVPLYPPVMPLTNSFGTCGWFGDQHELEEAQSLFAALNDTLRAVAGEFASRGVFVVDPLQDGSPFMQRDAAGNGTDACSPNQGLTAFWLLRAGFPLNPVNYLQMNIGAVLNDLIAGTLHPNTRGWQWMADLITAGFRAHM